MILDRFENAKFYVGIHPNIDKILEAVTSISADSFPSEKIFLDEKNAFMNPNQYETHPADNASFEAHRNYIDVMCMFEGEETIYVKNTDELSDVYMEYNPEKDALLAKFDTDNTPVLLKPGYFCILFPQDAHAPGCIAGTAQKVKKIVGKALL